MLKNIIGVILLIASVVLGIYVGFWLCFIGGIIGLIEVIKSNNIDGMLVAINILKIMFAGFLGYGSALVLAYPALRMLGVIK
jgi:hypothetical protein